MNTIFPGETRYVEDSKTYNMIPVSRRVRADMDTPVSIFLKTRANMLLESVEQGENVGRYSIIGLGRHLVMRLEDRRIEITRYDGNELGTSEAFELDNPLDKVRECFNQFSVPQYEHLPPFFGGAIGYLGYETHCYFEETPVNSEGCDGVPDGLLVVPRTVLVYDSVTRTLTIIALSIPGQEPGAAYGEAVERIDGICRSLAQPLPPPFVFREEDEAAPAAIAPRMEKQDFIEAVRNCKDHIAGGDIIQVVISQAFDVPTPVPPFELYRSLRILNPSPYLVYLDFDDFCLIGSSPEVMVRVRDGEILLKPIAGTRKRGRTVAEDAALAQELLADPKECAEHIMLVDLGRNDLGRVAAPGSVRVTDYKKIEKYSHVMHLVSTIKAEPQPGCDAFDVIRAAFPAGTLSGAPKIRAMEIIHQQETEKRGPYGGMVLNLGFNGSLDSCITIRTMVWKDGIARVQAGAGIVADSVPEKEYEETISKARALFEAIHSTGNGGGAALEETL